MSVHIHCHRSSADHFPQQKKGVELWWNSFMYNDSHSFNPWSCLFHWRSVYKI